MSTYKVITPESESDANYANFEYLLGWYDYQGSWQQYLFTDWENLVDFDNEIYNKEIEGRIGSVNKSEDRGVLLTVQDASINDFRVFLSMFRAEKIFRILKDGTLQACAPDSNSFQYKQRGIRFQFSFTISISSYLE